MIQKVFNDISKSDIEFLIENRVSELKTLEYKQELPGTQDGDKKEFLADISSFANASGGDIVYGIKELRTKEGKNTGEPEAVIPIGNVTPDEALRRLESLIRSGIEPRVPVQTKAIAGYPPDGNGFVVVVRIPQSLASPHMVTFKGTSRFYSRSSAGKYQLDVHEIRSAVLASDAQSEHVRQFIQDRLAKIIADETPVPLSTQHRLVLHILPLSSFLKNRRLQLSSRTNVASHFKPIGAGGWDNRRNLDGTITYDRDPENPRLNDSYCILFHNGTLEAVYSDVLRARDNRKPSNAEAGSLASQAYEHYLVTAIRSYFKGYKTFEVEPPAIVSLALIGCKGAYLTVHSSQRLDRDIAIFPDVQVDSYDDDVPSIMKPIFDAVWNAFGFERSFNYTESAQWTIRVL